MTQSKKTEPTASNRARLAALYRSVRHKNPAMVRLLYRKTEAAAKQFEAEVGNPMFGDALSVMYFHQPKV